MGRPAHLAAAVPILYHEPRISRFLGALSNKCRLSVKSCVIGPGATTSRGVLERLFDKAFSRQEFQRPAGAGSIALRQTKSRV